MNSLHIRIEQAYGRPPLPKTPDYGVLQVRGRVGSEINTYNVQPLAGHPLSIPRLLLVRRSSRAGEYGDNQELPF